MTGEEMERAIDFILKGRASLEAQMEQTNRLLGEYASMQATFVQVVTGTFAEQAEINRRQAEINRRQAEQSRRQAEQSRTQAEQSRRQSQDIRDLAKNAREQTRSIREQAAAQSQTDERLNALINIVERHISEGGHGQAP